MAIYVNKFKIPKSDCYDKDWWPSTQKSDVGLHVIHSFYPIIATSLLKSLLSIQNQQQPYVDNEQREEWQKLTVKISLRQRTVRTKNEHFTNTMYVLRQNMQWLILNLYNINRSIQMGLFLRFLQLYYFFLLYYFVFSIRF